MKIYLNSYRPLLLYREGQQAIRSYFLPPFIDYSCRKEPDFMSTYPSISALCRLEKFAPRLHEGDIVVYITCKGSYLDNKQRHWRFTSILEVFKRFEAHTEAGVWYTNEGVALPNNCMVIGNPPIPIERTAPITEFITDLRRWDLAYQKRARQCGVFLACKPQYLELHNPPIITDEIMLMAFNRIPGTQNPPAILQEQFDKLRHLCGI